MVCEDICGPDGVTVQGQIIYCPGCKGGHMLDSRWTFNGDYAKPTFSPSLLVNGSQTNKNQPRCHSFVRNGQIQFLGDCTHDLAGQTVDLTDWDDPTGDPI